MLANSIDKSKEFLIANPEYRLNLWEFFKFKYYFYKRKKGYPIAYITGKKEFYGLEFKINENVLVPRPETELMVEKAIEEIKEMENKTLLADIGTGSGCVAISILKNIDVDEVIAVDISDTALQVAKENAKKNGTEISFYEGDLMEPITSKIKKHKNIVITANLPYVTKDQFESEPSIQQEPKQALITKNEGLEYYEKLLDQISALEVETKKITLFFEIDPNQKKEIQQLIHKYFSKAKVEVIEDLSDRDRLVKIKI